jgi:hypothetical protein
LYHDINGCRPTDCPSAAASALQQECQKAFDLAREAVGWNGVFGALARFEKCRTRQIEVIHRTLCITYAERMIFRRKDLPMHLDKLVVQTARIGRGCIIAIVQEQIGGLFTEDDPNTIALHPVAGIPVCDGLEVLISIVAICSPPASSIDQR